MRSIAAMPRRHNLGRITVPRRHETTKKEMTLSFKILIIVQGLKLPTLGLAHQTLGYPTPSHLLDSDLMSGVATFVQAAWPRHCTCLDDNILTLRYNPQDVMDRRMEGK